MTRNLNGRNWRLLKDWRIDRQWYPHFEEFVAKWRARGVRMLTYRCIRRFVHRSHSRTIMSSWKSADMNFDGNWSYTWSEVEQSVTIHTEPLRKIMGICKCSAESHNSDKTLGLWGNVSHSAHDHFKYLLLRVSVFDNNSSVCSRIIHSRTPRTGPRSAPRRWISSIITSPTFCT